MHSSSLAVVDLIQKQKIKDVKPIYERHKVSIKAGPTALVKQIERDGGNWVDNALRGSGVSYREIVKFCADRLEVKYPKSAHVPTIELAIIRQLLKIYYESCEPEEREQTEKLIEALSNEKAQRVYKEVALKQGGKALAVVILEVISRKVLKQVIIEFLKKIAARETAKRMGGYVIPGAQILMVAWTAYDLMGPDLRMKRLLQTVLETALLRFKDIEDLPP